MIAQNVKLCGACWASARGRCCIACALRRAFHELKASRPEVEQVTRTTMSNDTKYIPPAFPVPPPNPSPNGDWLYASEGISIRDYFAARAIPALIDAAYDDLDKAAQDAYAIADAFLRAREL